MSFKHLVAALAVGPAAGWILPTSNIIPTQLPTFSLPSLSLPTLPTLPTVLPEPCSTDKSSASGQISSPTTGKFSSIGSSKPSSARSTPLSGSGKGATTAKSSLVTSVSKPTTTKPSAKSSAKSSKKPSSIASSIRPTSTGGSSVDTSSGKIIGHPAANVTGVTEYLGIPFAQPPVGNLRFAPPVAYKGNSTILGSKFGADCPATLENVPTALDPRLYNLLGSLGQVGDTLAEDCLFLNVWTKTQKSSVKKPVLIWIYGGGFSFGGTYPLAYSGKHFVQDEDVVFVSINYRVNVLGFPGAPGITQNLGLLDQRLAIEWVRDNIAQFGGDASRITIFGQSAGGASVDFYRYAWLDDPIVAGVIPMSGSSTSFAVRTPDQAAQQWYKVTTAVGCGNDTTSTPEAVLACMRQSNTTVDAIETAAAPGSGLSSLLGNFGPTVDDKVIFSNYTDLAVKGEFIKKPILTGNLNYESGLFILIAAGAGESYPQSVWDTIDLSVFTCPVSNVAQYAAQGGVPTWRYYYSGAWPNTLLPTANITQAWHTSEIPVIFGTVEEITAGNKNTQPETDLGNYLRRAWVTFATDPTNGLGAGEFNWPQYSSTGENVILLGQNNVTVAYGYSANLTQSC